MEIPQPATQPKTSHSSWEEQKLFLLRLQNLAYDKYFEADAKKAPRYRLLVAHRTLCDHLAVAIYEFDEEFECDLESELGEMTRVL